MPKIWQTDFDSSNSNTAKITNISMLNKTSRHVINHIRHIPHHIPHHILRAIL